MIERGYFGRALQIVADDPLSYILGGLILHALTALAMGLFVGPAICGIVWVTLKHCRNEEVTFADLFRGFDHFSNAVIAGVAFVLMVAGGLLLGVIPGIVLGSLFCFVFPFVVDQDLAVPEAMVASRKIRGPEDLLDRGFFFLLALVVGLSGIALFVVGLVFTWSLMWAVVAVAYEDLAASRSASARGAGRADGAAVA